MIYRNILFATITCLSVISCVPGIDDDDYMEKADILGTVILVDRPHSQTVFALISAPATDTLSSDNGTFIIQGDVYINEVIPLRISKAGYISVIKNIAITGEANYTGTILLYPDTTAAGG